MRWEQLFDDLGAAVEAEERAAFEAETADLARAERALLSTADRLRAHVGAVLVVHLVEGAALEGPLRDVGRDWAALDVGRDPVLVPLAAVAGVDGLSRAAVAPPDPAEPPVHRAGLATALRVVARDRGYVRVAVRGGVVLGGTVDRVGADHLDLALHPADEHRRPAAVTGVRCVPFAALVAVRGAGA